LEKRERTSRQGEKNIQWVPLKPTCVSFEIQAPNNKSMKDSRRTRNYMIEETGRNCSVVEVASKVSQDHDKNPCSSHNDHITTLLWSLKIMMKDQDPRSTHKLIPTRKKKFFKRIFLFQLTPPDLRSSNQAS
jgi:hypothetical protein